MRLLILGSAGPYPERLSAFTEAGHRVYHVYTEWLQEEAIHHAGITTCKYEEMGVTTAAATERLVKLIETERIEAVYSLLNIWDGSNRVTATLLDEGCSVPVIHHYKEHYISPDEDERRSIEKSTGVIFINEESRDYFALSFSPRIIHRIY
jgi:hypothetical protein